MKKISKTLLALMFLAFAAYGQQKEQVAIINTLDDHDSISVSDLNHLTARLREIAVNVLSAHYGVMTMESIVAFLGSQERASKECKEASCLADLGKKVNADYVAQGRIGRFSGNLTIRVELYNSKNGNLVGSFTGNSQNLYDLDSVLDDKAPDMFRKMLPKVSRTVPLPTVQGGIGNVETVTGGMFEYGKRRYVVNLNTEPRGANLSFNGVPVGSCSKTPCNVEIPEGDIRILAALEQYETADTTISVKQNKQRINIKLKPNFGVLEIKPAYSDGIGNNRQWDLIINKKSYYSFENRLSPGNYEVKLSHECYEDISFKVGINKDSNEVFYVSRHLNLKQGGLDLSTEKDGKPVSEPVFVNGKHKGETPFSGAVPICANVEIGLGRNMETVNVRLKNGEQVRHTHKIKRYSDYTSSSKAKTAKGTKKRTDENNAYTTTTSEKTSDTIESNKPISTSFYMGAPYMLNSINNLYSKIGFQLISVSLEFFMPKYNFFRIGADFNWGLYGFDKDAVREIHPDVDSLDGFFINAGAFIRLYPTDFTFLHGGASFGHYGSYNGKTKNGDKISGITTKTVVFPVGAGLVSPSFNVSKRLTESVNMNIFIEALYNIAMLKNGYGGYWTFSLGLKL